MLMYPHLNSSTLSDASADVESVERSVVIRNLI